MKVAGAEFSAPSDGVRPVSRARRNKFSTIVALDARPIAHQPSEINDYASEVVFSAITGQLFRWDSFQQRIRFDLSVGFRRFDACCEYEIYIDAQAHWANGEPIVASDFVRGIEHLFAIRAPASHRLVGLRYLGTRNLAVVPMGAQAEALVVRLASPDVQLPCKLSHPSYGPIAKRSALNRCSDWGGPFIARDWLPERVVIRRRHQNSIFSTDVEFRPIEDPSDAVQQYLAGMIDSTCPTSFPAKCYATLHRRPDFRRSESSTFFALVPVSSRVVQSKILRWLSNRLRLCSIIDEFSGSLAPFTSFSDMRYLKPTNRQIDATPQYERDLKPPDLGCNPVVFGFDEFHPNRQVLEALIAQIPDRELNTRIVADDFFQPTLQCDLKLVVLCNSPSYPLDLYRRLLVATEFQVNTTAKRSYLAALEKYDASEHEIFRLEALQTLDKLLHQEMPLLPLFKFNQHYLASDLSRYIRWDGCWN